MPKQGYHQSVLLAALALISRVQTPLASNWELIVLGVAQDAGFPHLGCSKPCCVEKRKGHPERVSSIGVRNAATGESFLFDATPDVVDQIHHLNGGIKPTGVFLTHAHMGHYSGLLYFGRESADWKGVPIYGSRRMGKYLEANDPWKYLVANKNIELRLVEPDAALRLADGLEVTGFLVPHRDEFTDTLGFIIEGPNRSAVFIPDIDRWEKWDRSIRDLANKHDLLFLDGTFSSPAEVGGRDIEQIPHPMIPHTREFLKGTKGKVRFIHLNHTNPAYGSADVVREGQVFRL